MVQALRRASKDVHHESCISFAESGRYSISNNHEPEIAPVLAEACAQMLVGLDAVAAAIGRPGSQGLGQESLDIRIEHYWVIEHQAFKRLGISAAFVMLFHGVFAIFLWSVVVLTHSSAP